MKFLVVFLTITAVSFEVHGNEEECAQKRIEACAGILLKTFDDERLIEGFCKGLQNATDCLDNAANDCFGIESDEDFEMSLQGLEEAYKKNCFDSEEAKKCLEENRKQMTQCAKKMVQDYVPLFEKKYIIPYAPHALCNLYFSKFYCVVDVALEKCDLAVATEIANREYWKVPYIVDYYCYDVKSDLYFFDIKQVLKRKSKGTDNENDDGKVDDDNDDNEKEDEDYNKEDNEDDNEKVDEDYNK